MKRPKTGKGLINQLVEFKNSILSNDKNYFSNTIFDKEFMKKLIKSIPK